MSVRPDVAIDYMTRDSLINGGRAFVRPARSRNLKLTAVSDRR
jgi:hypothetical protein